MVAELSIDAQRPFGYQEGSSLGSVSQQVSSNCGRAFTVWCMNRRWTAIPAAKATVTDEASMNILRIVFLLILLSAHRA